MNIQRWFVFGVGWLGVMGLVVPPLTGLASGGKVSLADMTPRARAELMLQERIAFQHMKLTLMEEVQRRADRGETPLAYEVTAPGRALGGGLHWVCVGTSKGLVHSAFSAPEGGVKGLDQFIKRLPPGDEAAWRETIQGFSEDDLDRVRQGGVVSGLEPPGWVLAAAGTAQGVRITGVKRGSPAARLSLAVGHLLTHLEGRAVRSCEEADAWWNAYAPGSLVQVRILNPATGERRTHRLEIRNRPAAGLGARLGQEEVQQAQRYEQHLLKVLGETLRVIRHCSEAEWDRLRVPTIHAVATVEWSTRGRGSADPRGAITQHVRPVLSFPGYPHSPDVLLPPTRKAAIRQMEEELRELDGPSEGQYRDLTLPWERDRWEEGMGFLRGLTDGEYGQRVVEAVARGQAKPVPPLPVQSPGVWLGLDVEAVALPERPQGQPVVRVTSVKRGSPGAQAGVKPGDLLSHLETYSLSEPATLTEALKRLAPGNRVVVKGWRAAHALSLRLTLETMP